MVIVPLLMLRIDAGAAMSALGAIAAVAVAADFVRSKHHPFERFIQRWFGRIMRHEEDADPGGRVRINGATWLFIGAFLATTLFGARAGAVGLAVFIVADAVAGLVGRRFGRRRWLGARATLLGSSAFFATAVAVGLLLPGTTATACLVAAAAGAVAEAATPVDDNFVVPAVAAAVYYFL
jgi:dolichol kinase